LTLDILYNIISSDLAEESFHQVAGSVLTHSSLLELPLKSVVQEEYKSLMFLRMGLKRLSLGRVNSDGKTVRLVNLPLQVGCITSYATESPLLEQNCRKSPEHTWALCCVTTNNLHLKAPSKSKDEIPAAPTTVGAFSCFCINNLERVIVCWIPFVDVVCGRPSL